MNLKINKIKIVFEKAVRTPAMCISFFFFLIIFSLKLCSTDLNLLRSEGGGFLICFLYSFL